VPQELPLHGASGTAVVCAASGLCEQHQCDFGCDVDADCLLLTGGPSCDATTHRCHGCSSDDDCASAGTGLSHCDVPSGLCQCADDNDCVAPASPHCIAGSCACAGVNDCTTYPDATPTCD
jgi:hypothetical protein